VIAGYLAFIFEPIPEIPTLKGWGTLLTVGLGCQIIWKVNVYSVWFILFPVIAAYLTFIFEPAREIQNW
jgi:hypothetical protein